MKKASAGVRNIFLIICAVCVIGATYTYADETYSKEIQPDVEFRHFEDNDNKAESVSNDENIECDNEDNIEEVKVETIEENIDYDGELGVTVSSVNGEYYALSDGEILYANDTIKLSPEKLTDQFGDKIIKIENKYSFSYDGGKSFDEEKILEDSTLVLSPIRDGDEYIVKLYTYVDTEMTTEKIEEEIYESENIEDVEGAEGKCVRKIRYITHHITHRRYISKVYRIMYDISEPEINDVSGVDWDKWVNYDRDAGILCTDSVSGLSRVIIRTPEEVLYEYHISDSGDTQKSISASIALNEEAQDVNGRQIKIEAVDLAGNYSEKVFIYHLDMSVPTIKYSGPGDGTKTSGDINLLISASDTIMDTLSLEYTILLKGKGQNDIVETDVIRSVDDVLELSRMLTVEGEYDITAEVFDAAGNYSERVNVRLRIDKTSPAIFIEGFEKGNDYRRDVESRIRVSERFYSDCTMSVKIIRKWPGGSDSFYEDTCLTENLDTIKNINFNEDGDYTIIVSAIDAAGNTSSIESGLRVDKTRPEIYITGLSNKQITSGHPQLLLNTHELFYDSASAETKLYKKIDGSIYSEPITVLYAIESEQWSIPFEVYEEGEYMLSFSVNDRAGNYNTVSLEFIYDCTSPVIGWIQNFNRKYLKTFKFPSLFSANVTDATPTLYRAFINTSELREGDEITKDGKYVLRVIATDAAGNVSDESVEFIVDATPPKIVAKGIDNTMNAKIGSEVSFTLYDKGDFFRECKYNGSDMEILEDGLTCRTTIHSGDEQNIRIVAEDLAGNVTEKLFVLNASALGNSSRMTKVIKSLASDLTSTITGGADSDSVKIDKKNDEKFPYIYLLAFLGVLTAGTAILLVLRRIDTTK